VAPAALPVVEGLDPNALALILQILGSSPLALGLFFGLWLGGRAVGAALKLVLDAKADAAIRAVVGLSMSIRGLAQPTPQIVQERRPTTRRTGPQRTVTPQ
jgi:hypothetical protein